MTVVKIVLGIVRIGIEAPPEMAIVREEIRISGRRRAWGIELGIWGFQGFGSCISDFKSQIQKRTSRPIPKSHDLRPTAHLASRGRRETMHIQVAARIVIVQAAVRGGIFQ